MCGVNAETDIYFINVDEDGDISFTRGADADVENYVRVPRMQIQTFLT